MPNSDPSNAKTITMQPVPNVPNAGSAGQLFLVVAPSGAGKSSLVNALLARDPQLSLSISCTTRAPRPGEVNGREYHFLTVEDFLRRKEHGDFLETAQVHGNHYGTSRRVIEEFLAAGTDVLLEIDWQGAAQVKALFPPAVEIFLLPPSMETLAERLHKRGQDSEAVIRRRLEGAAAEIAHAPDADYVIVNRDFDVALSELQAVVAATRLRVAVQAVRNRDLFAQLGIAPAAKRS